MPQTRQPRKDLRQHLASGEQTDLHHHREHQLLYPARGLLAVTTDAGTWMAPPHRAVWIPAGAPHRYRAWGDTDMRAVLFTPARPAYATPAVLSVSGLLRQLLLALTEPGGRSGASRRRLELVALEEMQHAPEQPLHLPEPRDDRLLKVTGYLREHPGDATTLAELGRRFGASERTLSRLFSTELHMPFHRWRTQLRIHHALVLLASGHSVTRTATESGWHNVSSFIHAFASATGDTPGNWSAQLRATADAQGTAAG